MQNLPQFNYEAGENVTIQPGAVAGLQYKAECGPLSIGNNSIIRTGSIIYGDVSIGNHFQMGHNSLIRENTKIGDHVLVGSGSVIDGTMSIANCVKIESNCYICTHVEIGHRVFLGPNVVLTNDRFPLRDRDNYKPEGPILEDGVTLGGGVVIMPGVRVGADSFVAGGAVVTHDVPPKSFVKGVPGRAEPLPANLDERNMAPAWRKFLGVSE